MKNLLITASALLLGAGIGSGVTIGITADGHPSAAPTQRSAGRPTTTAVPKVAPSLPRLQRGDFRIGIHIRQRECFGSAGCNITYQINPRYVGTADLSRGTWDVTYRVRGGDSGPVVNTFRLHDGEASYDEEEMVSTSSEHYDLAASVVAVDPVTSG